MLESISTNSYLSTMAPFFVPVDSSYINPYLNLSTMAMATKVCPQMLK